MTGPATPKAAFTPASRTTASTGVGAECHPVSLRWSRHRSSQIAVGRRSRRPRAQMFPIVGGWHQRYRPGTCEDRAARRLRTELDTQGGERVLVKASEGLVRTSPALFAAPAKSCRVEFNARSVVVGTIQPALLRGCASPPTSSRFRLRNRAHWPTPGALYEVGDLLTHSVKTELAGQAVPDADTRRSGGGGRSGIGSADDAHPEQKIGVARQQVQHVI